MIQAGIDFIHLHNYWICKVIRINKMDNTESEAFFVFNQTTFRKFTVGSKSSLKENMEIELGTPFIDDKRMKEIYHSKKQGRQEIINVIKTEFPSAVCKWIRSGQEEYLKDIKLF